MNEITKELLEALKACLKNCARWHPADPTVLGAISAIAKAEAALAAPQPADDGWIPWNGGDCPVTVGTRVDAKFRDGARAYYNIPSGDCDWSHMESDYDIIAYRVVKP